MGEDWLTYDEYMRVMVAGDGDDGPPAEFAKLDHAFPPSPPFPPWEDGCGSDIQIRTCPYSSQFQVGPMGPGNIFLPIFCAQF